MCLVKTNKYVIEGFVLYVMYGIKVEQFIMLI